MARIAINALTNNCLILNFSLENQDNFLMCNYPKSDGVVNLSYAEFINTYLRDNNGYMVNKISVTDENDEYYAIKINYKYLENKNGVHIFTDAYNELFINKELYNGSYFQKLIEEESKILDSIKDEISLINNEINHKISDINERVWPEVLKIIDNFYNDDVPINFQFYNINQEEFREYIKNNKSYIIRYILDNNEYLKMLFKSSLILSGISLFGMMASGLDESDATFTISAFMLASSMIVYLSAVGYNGKKLYDLCNSKEKIIRYRKREI